MEIEPDIPGYKILTPIGKGGMAVVYLALQESLDREVALKVMKPALESDPTLCSRFLKEGKIVAQMSSHPGIVTVFDIGCHDKWYYMAMEYIPGESLKQRIEQGTSAEQPLKVVREIALALMHAHDLGFVHRDVKPGNILFRENGAAVLTDFGIAKAVQSDTDLTHVGFTVGSPAYMSPEQTMGGFVDARSDLYALGVVFYEMLTGRKPFLGESTALVASMHRKSPIPQLPDNFSSYQGILNRLMTKQPDDRFQNAGELIESIDAFSDKTMAAQSKHQNEGADRARQLRVGVTGLGMLAVLSSLLWYMFTVRQPVQRPGVESELPPVNKEALDSASSETQRKIERLLEIAAAHEAVGRFTEPLGANAFEAYSLVLEIEPENQSAQRGLRRVQRLAAEAEP